MSTATIGPVLAATIVSKHYRASIDNWCDYLGQHIHSQEVITQEIAEQWGFTELTGREVTWLANELGEPWLRLIDSPESTAREPFTHYGWLSLEINVQDVDRLYETIKDSPFKIIGEPADLDVSDDIRAMQVVGLDGEVLYLTQIKAEVPPFELPLARCAVDRLFIPVCMVKDRAQALEIYQAYPQATAYQFDTKITVINNALGNEISQRHPIATVQLAGNHMVELDEISGLATPQLDSSLPQAGISSISFEVSEVPTDLLKKVAKNGALNTLASGPQKGRRSVSITGPSCERIELIC